MKRVIIAAALAVLAGTSANAAVMSCTVDDDPTTNKDESVTYTLGSATAVECYEGQDTGNKAVINSVDTFLGLQGWTLADKNDDATSGDQSIRFDGGPVNDTQSGMWEITGATTGNSIMITLKASTSFAAFLVDSLSGTWSSSKDLSHASIYYTTNNNNPPPVPLPAGAVLLISGLAALGLGRRLKS